MRTNSRAEILKCAMMLFSKNGYEGTSPNEIVETVGITKPTMYYFFGDKEGLLNTLLSENYTKLNDVLNHVCIYHPDPENYDNDVKPLLMRIAKSIFKFAELYKEFFIYNISLNSAPVESKAAKVSEKYSLEQYEIITRLFSEISKAHGNLAGKEATLAFRFISLLNAQVTLWFREKSDLSDTTAESLVIGFMHGIF